MQNPQRSFSGRRTTGTKTDTLPRTARSWIFLIIMRAHPASITRRPRGYPRQGGGTGGAGAVLRRGKGTSCSKRSISERDHRSAAPDTSPYAAGRTSPPRMDRFRSTPPRGGRPYRLHHQAGLDDFNPRPPRGGRRSRNRAAAQRQKGFQSTPPARGATISSTAPSLVCINFNPRAPQQTIDFNPRPPRGGRRCCGAGCRARMYFNPRPPRGGRRPKNRGKYNVVHFNPRPPRGGRRFPVAVVSWATIFQSTPPARGATALCCSSDLTIRQFQSTPPARGATTT